MKRKKKRGLFVLLILVAVMAGGWFYIDSLAYKVCRVEAGITVTPSDFLKTPDEAAIFTPESQPFEITEPGEYAIRVKSGWFTHSCTLIIEDTQIPKGKPQDVFLTYGESCQAADFVTDIQDMTQVSVTFVEEPDFTKPGKQPVKILLTDRGNNVLTLQADLNISRVMEELVWEAGDLDICVNDFLIKVGDKLV